MIKRLKRLFSNDDGIAQEELRKLKGLSEDERRKELGTVLYESAFQNAAKFVHDELKRPESPFAGLDRHQFFSEVLIMNFWIMGKVFRKYSEKIADEMHQHYFGSLPDIAERNETFRNRIRSYNLCWDEYSGHHDEFGLKAGEVVFGSTAYSERTVSFWIISYADDSIKKFKRIRKTLRQQGII